MKRTQRNNVKIALLLGLFLMLNMRIFAADTPPRGRGDFASMKQEMITRLKTKLACVEAAKDDAALRACRPRPPQGGPGGPGGQGGGTDSNKYNLPDF